MAWNHVVPSKTPESTMTTKKAESFPEISKEKANNPTSPQDLNLTSTNDDVLNIVYRQENMVKLLYHALRKGNVLCRDVKHHRNASLVVYRFELNCADMYEHQHMGTGNILQALYGVRLAARVLGNIPVRMQCSDAQEKQSQLILPWIMGVFPPTQRPETPQTDAACKSLMYAPIHWLGEEIQYELRRMALALVGIPYPTHPAADFVLSADREKALQVPMPTVPLLSNVEVDDVAIHFRCGDIIEKRPHPDYGYARFSFLLNYISREARSIGIVTQPFQGQIRGLDGTTPTRCPILVEALQQYLQQHFPRATVQIRNSSNETITLSFARFILANQSVAAGDSTFVALPFLASFGTSYLTKPQFVMEDALEQYGNAQFIEYDDKMTSVRLFELWNETDGQQQVKEWFYGH